MSETGKPTGFPRILVADDHEDVQVLVGSIFSDLGYEVELVSDGWQAIESLDARGPDLVVLDLRMPLADGWEVLAHARGLAVPPPVVIVSACGDSASLVRAVHEGAAAYLFKPFRVRELTWSCERVLGLWKTSDVARERRRQPRRVLALDITARPQGGLSRSGHLVDVSEGGAQLDLDVAVATGGRVRFALRIPDGQVPLSVEGSVRWRDALSNGFSHGLAFDRMAPEERRQLEEFLPPTT